MTDDKFDYGFAIDWMRKDLAIVIEEAKRNGSPVPITEIIDGYYAEVQKMGGNRWDSYPNDFHPFFEPQHNNRQ